MKGPDRPHTMQTTRPPLTRPEGGSAKTIAVPSIGSGKSDSGRVGNTTLFGED
jgi:hypothetical protein